MKQLTHLQRLEAESIHILREVVAEAEKPVMLYSIGKDSAVMLHLARRRSTRPRRRSRCCTSTRRGSSGTCTRCASKVGARSRDGADRLPEPRGRGARDQPVRPRPAAHRHVEDRGAQAGARQIRLRRGLRRRAARRGEEPRQGAHVQLPHRNHRWDPKNQRPELWNLYNARKNKGESIRVFPISNWTELDIWQYIHARGDRDRPAVLRRRAPDGRARRA